MFIFMKQAVLIGCSSADVHKQMIPENYKGKRSLSQSLSIQIQERIFPACFLPFSGLFSYHFFYDSGYAYSPLTPDQEPKSMCAYLHLQIYTEWYQQ